MNDLRSDPQALETAWISVIAFGNTARQLCPLTEICCSTEPLLQAGGDAALGEALRLLDHCLDQEVRKSTPTQKGDYKPYVLLMSDGHSTDAWEEAAGLVRRRRPNLLAFAASPAAHLPLLKKFSELVLTLADLEQDGFRRFVKFTAPSSTVLGGSTPDSKVELPRPGNSGIRIVL